MLGDFIPEQEALARGLVLDTSNSSTSVSSALRLTVAMPAGHRVNCVLAASLHMHGDVRLVGGGPGAPNVSVAYETRDGLPDLLFVLVESHGRRPALNLRNSIARSSRVTILYDRMAKWTLPPDVDLDEEQDGGLRPREG